MQCEFFPAFEVPGGVAPGVVPSAKVDLMLFQPAGISRQPSALGLLFGENRLIAKPSGALVECQEQRPVVGIASKPEETSEWVF